MAAADPHTQALFDAAERLLRDAKAQGADAADVLIAEGTAVDAGCRLGEIEDIGRSEGRDLGLRLMFGRRQAVVSSNDLSEKGLAPLAERCAAMARIAPEDPYCGLAPEDRLATSFPALDLSDTAEVATERLVEMARAAEDAARSVDGIVNSNGAGAGYARSRIVLATSHGFAQSYESTSYSVSCQVVAGNDDGMETDYDSTSARHLADLQPAEDIGLEAARRAVRRLSPRKVDTRKVPLIVEPRLASGILGHLAGAINGSAIARGTSFLKDALDTEVFAPHVHVHDDPRRVRGLRSKPFDGEGVAAEALTVIDAGRLTTWFLDSGTARQLGLETNGRASRGTAGAPSPSITNFYMAPGTDSPEDLIKDIGQGLYVTTLFGQGVNLVTGDYSRGAAGFWIENGEIAYPVSEITVAGHLKDMFRHLTPANDLTFRYGVNAPTLRIEGLTVAG